jgi:hypothetical protein
MNILIERGANVNVSYIDKRRPLHGASLSGDLKKVKFLMELKILALKKNHLPKLISNLPNVSKLLSYF